MNAFRKHSARRSLVGKVQGTELPAFVFLGGEFSTRQSVNVVLHQLLGSAYSSHGLRIGAATLASDAEIPPEKSRLLGR